MIPLNQKAEDALNNATHRLATILREASEDLNQGSMILAEAVIMLKHLTREWESTPTYRYSKAHLAVCRAESELDNASEDLLSRLEVRS